MAVKPKAPKAASPQIRDYWRRYHHTAMVITLLMQVVITLVIGLALVSGGESPASLAFWMTLTATLFATSILNYIIVDILLTPLRDISMAITNSAGQKPTHPLANPNTPRYESSGFKPLLQYIYDLSANTLTVPGSAQGSVDESVAFLETALRETNAGFVVMNSQGTILYANQAAPVSKTTDGKQKLDLIFETAPDLHAWIEECRTVAVRAETSWVRVPNRLSGDEERRIFNVSANYEKGSIAEVVLVTHDATNIFQPEDDELDFISFAAHELRGPITVIRGYLDVLETELDDKLALDQKELFKRLIVSANRLSGYINNILNTNKYDRRHLKIHLSEESVSSIYATIRDDMALRAQSQRRMLSVDIPSTLPSVAADRSSITEVFSNLIDNALKYSNDGGAVWLKAEQEGDFVKISVSDNGIGMPGNVIGNLFHKFYRSHRSRETVAGTGIGLYICKAIVESHGGQISVSSTEGIGSTFSFTLPTYSSVVSKLQANDYTNAGLISSHDGWIKNHSKYTG